jgi:N-acetylmuramoyl-L-alanine amidase
MQTRISTLLVLLFLMLAFPLFSQGDENKFVVVLDAGHGGHDPGRPTKFDKEKNVALKIVLAVGRQLEANKNVKVIYTRKTDIFLELHERSAIANKADADLFVSIHCNAHTSQAYGTETFVLSVENTGRNFDVAKAENEVIYLEENYEQNYEGFDPNSPESLIGLALLQEDYVEQSIWLASRVENNFKNNLKRKSRGVKQQPLWVIHNTYMPSVLIETGFLTNKSEGQYLSSKNGQQKIAKQIANAILDYKKEWITISNSTVLIESEPEIKDTPQNIIYKVQIAAGSRKLETKPYNFKGLKGVAIEPFGNGYKYFYGNTTSYENAKELQREAKAKGYTTCFIVAYKNGEQVKISDL